MNEQQARALIREAFRVQDATIQAVNAADAELINALRRIAARIKVLPPAGDVLREQLWRQLRPQLIAELDQYAESLGLQTIATLRQEIDQAEAVARVMLAPSVSPTPPAAVPTFVLGDVIPVNVGSVYQRAILNAEVAGRSFLEVFGVSLDDAGGILKVKGTQSTSSRFYLQSIERLVTQGVLTGRSTDAIVRDLVSESAGGLNLGVTGKQVKHQATTVVRTAIQDAMARAHEQVWDANADVIKKWEFDASMDSNVCPWCAMYDGDRASKRSDLPKVPLHPRCVLGNTPVSTGGLVAATRAVYSGDIVTIRTEGGSEFTVTAQHPVLTDHGWVRANELANGVNLIRHRERIPSRIDLPNLDNAPATAAEVFQAFRATQGVATTVVPAAPMYFHGDGEHIQGEIEVVTADRPLQMNPTRQLLKVGEKFQRIGADAELELVTGFGSLDFLFIAVNATASGFVGMASDALAFFWGRGSHTDAHRFAASTRSDPSLAEPSYEHSPRTAALLSELLDGCSELVTADQVVNVEIEAAHGITVYDFTTLSGIYSADQLVTHNCRCRVLPIVDEDEDEDPSTAKELFTKEEMLSKTRKGESIKDFLRRKNNELAAGAKQDERWYLTPVKKNGETFYMRAKDIAQNRRTMIDWLAVANKTSQVEFFGGGAVGERRARVFRNAIENGKDARQALASLLTADTASARAAKHYRWKRGS